MARPLHFTADFLKFVSIDERPAMGSQLNMASRSEVVLIYKSLPKKGFGPSPKSGAKKTLNY